VKVFSGAEEVTRMAGQWAEVRPLDHGTCQVTMRVESLEWPAMLLGALDADFEVVTPAELTGHLREIGRRFTRCCAPVSPRPVPNDVS
jgi:hypothetical protein